jgi:hypothetical protein
MNEQGVLSSSIFSFLLIYRSDGLNRFPKRKGKKNGPN